MNHNNIDLMRHVWYKLKDTTKMQNKDVKQFLLALTKREFEMLTNSWYWNYDTLDNWLIWVYLEQQLKIILDYERIVFHFVEKLYADQLWENIKADPHMQELRKLYEPFMFDEY